MTRRRARKGQAESPNPTLDPDIVDDDERLGAVLGDVAEADADYRRTSRRIVRLQGQLRELLGEGGWAVYLKLEVAVNDRNADLNETLVRWAFAEGRKHPSGQR